MKYERMQLIKHIKTGRVCIITRLPLEKTRLPLKIEETGEPAYMYIEMGDDGERTEWVRSQAKIEDPKRFMAHNSGGI